MDELNVIVNKFIDSGWDLIAEPAKKYLEDKSNKQEFIDAVIEADKQCGSCGCELDPLYKKFIKLKELL
jgi:hypothetical protein